MRVVSDAGNVRSVIENDPQAAIKRPAPAPAAAKPALPMMAAILFLLACIGGGVVIAFVRPFGLG
ncbi:hypothetical protein [Sphingomonas sp. R-74633]|uniref:hypothetical protein n=1 Tax=Sphingomonas sp. R-74633 TaxID=2751188 RepID=UPI0015D39486|nr:hypothetical protein [Sphingomonas sp. R-74633]